MRRLRRTTPGPGPEAKPDPFEVTTSEADRAIIEAARPHTITSTQRLQGVIDAVRYVHRRGIDGAFAECGVWKGGSVLAMLRTLQDEQAPERDVYLYDTFEGMTAPTGADTSPFEASATQQWEQAQARGERAWKEYFSPDTFSEDGVRETLTQTGYDPGRLHLVRGRVEDTIPGTAPDRLALLRLDTDWYESTRHELEHLYPRLASGGVLIIDDYGHWEGARRAVEELFEREPPLLLTRVDYTARMAVKA